MQQGPVRVFVVDDHAVVRRGLRAYLESVDDMEVVGEATDGREALEDIAALVAAGEPPDVVLMDLLMPGMDGVTATAAITDRHPELAVVAMTSFTQAELVAPEPQPLQALTDREREVLVLVAQGLSNQQIADALVISERTARTHVSNILSKLGVASRTQAALLAIREGVAPAPPAT